MYGFLKNRVLTKANLLAVPVVEVPGLPITEETARIEHALANSRVINDARYETRENSGGGWSVFDRQSRDTAQTYGYRLSRMNRQRAESLVEVLNRAEARQRGRNG